MRHTSTREQLAGIAVNVRYLRDMVEPYIAENGDEDALFDPIARMERELDDIFEALVSWQERTDATG